MRLLMSSNLKDLAQVIHIKCKELDIDYDPSALPIKLTADCYIIYGTPLNEDCTKSGKCRVFPYYAMTGGDSIQILDKYV